MAAATVSLFAACGTLLVAVAWANYILNGEARWEPLVHARLAAVVAATVALPWALRRACSPRHRQYIIAAHRLMSFTLVPEKVLSLPQLQHPAAAPGLSGWLMDGARIVMGALSMPPPPPPVAFITGICACWEVARCTGRITCCARCINQ